MKRETKLVALVIAVLMLIGVSAGCSRPETIDLHTPTYENPDRDDSAALDLSMEMVPLTAAPAMFIGPIMPSAPGTLTQANSKATIDYSNTSDGYIMIRFMNSTDKQLRVRITGPSGTIYQYTLKQNGEYEVYPLSDGNGSYSVGVFEQVEGSQYSTAVTATISVTLIDEFAPFLRPNQYVNFSADSRTVARAAELIGGEGHLTDQISTIYNFVVSSLTYNRTFAEEVTRGMHSNYVPDIDAILESGTGICFDYAAVMTAMLRSQGIPTRLVIGYAGDQYHAWIDVYSQEEGWINSSIFFDGENWKLMDPTFASSGGQSDRVMQYIGDGSNYSASYLY